MAQHRCSSILAGGCFHISDFLGDVVVLQSALLEDEEGRHVESATGLGCHVC